MFLDCYILPAPGDCPPAAASVASQGEPQLSVVELFGVQPDGRLVEHAVVDVVEFKFGRGGVLAVEEAEAGGEAAQGEAIVPHAHRKQETVTARYT